MAKNVEQSSSPQTRRRTGETRALLIDACVDLVREEGLGALTVQRVTRAARITPPGFYKHFESIDRLLSEAVGGFMEDLAGRQSVSKVLGQVDNLTALPDEEARRQIADHMLSVLTSEPRFADLYLRYRNDPTMLGGTLAKVADRVRDDTVGAYWAVAQRMGALPEHYARVALLAEQSLAIYYRAGEMLLSKRYERDLILETTVSGTVALTNQLLKESWARKLADKVRAKTG